MTDLRDHSVEDSPSSGEFPTWAFLQEMALFTISFPVEWRYGSFTFVWAQLQLTVTCCRHPRYPGTHGTFGIRVQG